MPDQLFQTANGLRIAIVAGESSGDLLGAELIAALLERFPNAQFSGVCGPKMMSAGAKTIEPMETLAVGGVAEVVRHLPKLLKLRKRLINAIANEKPDLFISVDAPDFNIGLAKKIKKLGIPTVHYVSPSIWAWRPERIKSIKAAVSHMLLLLPFELDIYKKESIPATYVGHPLADLMPLHANKLAAREVLNLNPNEQALAILPGSRQRELEALAPLFVKTAMDLARKYPDLNFLVPLITRETRSRFENEIWAQGAQNLKWRLMFGHSHEAMIASDVILLASGTAALEAMLAKRPTVVAYKVSELTYKIVKRKFLLPYVSLPNIISGRFLVPEFIQEDASPENLMQVLSTFLSDKQLAADLAVEFTQQHELLKCNGAQRAADAVAQLLPRAYQC